EKIFYESYKTYKKNPKAIQINSHQMGYLLQSMIPIKKNGLRRQLKNTLIACSLIHRHQMM
ncbi:hypothetical protein, partial [Bacillus zhangzhouensis]|uniref:hypothetical protein n=1 Tax=Bacillus zhangzhouensis TaxID=1178540 RepID=UPI0019552700